MKIDLEEPWFVHGEAAEVAGVAKKDLENWVQRQIIDLGTMHRSGRRLYSVIDLIKLRVIGDLAQFLGMRPGFAAAVAESVMPRAAEIAALGDDGELLHRGYYGKDTPQYLIAWAVPDKDQFSVARRSEAELVQDIKDLSHPVVSVPLDQIALTVTLRALRKLETEK